MILAGRVGLFVRRSALALLLVGAVGAQAVLRPKVSVRVGRRHRSAGGFGEDPCAASGRSLPTRRPLAASSCARRIQARRNLRRGNEAGKLFEMTFQATAGKPYRLWVHGRADRNYWANDSVFVQFSGSVTESGAARYRIGTTSAAEVNLEDCRHCGISGWAWQDNGYGADALGPAIYFAKSRLANHPRADARRRAVDRSDPALAARLPEAAAG